MKRVFNKYIGACLMLLAVSGMMQGCSDDGARPEQPDFISVSLKKPMIVDPGDVFEMSVPNVGSAEEYEWTVPEDMLDIIKGQGTNVITVEVKADAHGVISDGAIYVVAVNSNGESYRRSLYNEITILKPAPTLPGYRTKRYGTKTWMVENLNEAGEGGNMGRPYGDDPANAAIYGRLYTWHEAMTGIANCTESQNPIKWGASGIDDAGNPYSMNGGAASYNMQIRGVCPEGWHVPNIYDMYDLVRDIKAVYSIPAVSLNDVAANFNGYIMIDRESGNHTAAFTLTNSGFVGAYLKGSGPNTAANPDGLWLTTKTTIYNDGTTFSYGGNSTFPNSTDYPLYMPERMEIGFDLLPGGKRTGSSGAYSGKGDYSFHWASFLYLNNSDVVAMRRSASSNNANWSAAAEPLTNSCYVRCVANY